ncbi:hypothetical protein HNR44_002796 [Geomicrobium halophilum]|uniref:Spore coat protein D n=1 Tax=Geomicrobium halophilum TaxID=549000 RepID=A0A841PUI1_9BACL|nr:CotD family spore coat protein [Geomicrobium halophilum]MBB6450806.1 hypothetical protein [Geomicrobium halophilum]
MFGRHPGPPGPPFYPPHMMDQPRPLEPYVEEYIVPEIFTVETKYVKNNVYKHVHHYPHWQENYETVNHVHDHFPDQHPREQIPITEYPYNDHPFHYR